MHNNNSILSTYISLLKKHIERTSNFTKATDDWLSDSIAADLFFTDASNAIVREELGLRPQLTSSQKIITLIKEIADSSKSYLEKLAILSVALEDVIKLVVTE